MFGGMTPWAANLSSVMKQWRHGQGRDWAWHNKLPESAYLTVRALSDLWHFNGDAAHPVWTRIGDYSTHRASSNVGGLSAWPPAATGQGWQAHGQLWLWVTLTGEQPACNWISCRSTNHCKQQQKKNGPSGEHCSESDDASNQLWVFSPATLLWERVTQAGVDVAARVVDLRASPAGSVATHQRKVVGGSEGGMAGEAGAVEAVVASDGVGAGKFGAWPGARDSPLVTSDGCLFSGFGRDECAVYGGGRSSAEPQPLSGLWRWVVTNAGDLEGSK